MRIRTFLKPLSFLPAILVMYMIFSFSSQEADVSSRMSHAAGVRIVSAADYVFDMDLESWQIEQYADRIEGVTRKLAHMGEYFLLAVSISFPLYVYGLHGILLMIVAGMICVGYALGDEYHQSFVAGRSAQLRDVGIDSAGALIGIIVVRIIGFAGRHTIFRPRRKELEASRREFKAMQREQERLRDELREREAREEFYRRRATRNYRKQEDKARSSRNEDRYDAPYDNRYDTQYDDRYAARYDDRYNDRYADHYDNRYDEHYDDRQDARYDDRYDDRKDVQYDDRYDDRYDDQYEYDDFSEEYSDASIDTSDELSDDMPFSHLLNRKKRKR